VPPPLTSPFATLARRRARSSPFETLAPFRRSLLRVRPSFILHPQEARSAVSKDEEARPSTADLMLRSLALRRLGSRRACPPGSLRSRHKNSSSPRPRAGVHRAAAAGVEDLRVITPGLSGASIWASIGTHVEYDRIDVEKV